ncbi:hypothetical protein [Pyxidicoccus trucidator]|uniref:hypothetical protein n=1 Tax=Pyxidicoccus trucidator TaxID=2709662 RepID=UPI0013DAE88D|nr:hypothetical protein [Pyxidicoccus trucidator]
MSGERAVEIPLSLKHLPGGRVVRMTRETAPDVARFHEEFAGNQRLTAKVLEYEYLHNPIPGGGLYCAVDATGRIVATQGCVPHRLRRGAAELDSLMLERALCRPDLQKTGVQVMLGSAGLRDVYPSSEWPLLWGKTSLASPATLACGVDYRKRLDAGDTPPAAPPHLHFVEGLGPDALGFLERVYAAHPDTCFLSHTPALLRWMVLENPFVRFTTGVLQGASGIEAVAIVRAAWEGMARVDELLTLPGADLDALVRALELELRRRQFKGIRFVLNGLHAPEAPLGEVLVARGFSHGQDGSLLNVRHGSRSAREILSHCAISGLWAPPFWAAAGVPPRSTTP